MALEAFRNRVQQRCSNAPKERWEPDVPSSPDVVQQLVDYPQESLAIELKGWFDPNSPEEQAKIVRGCIAMRNRGTGGFILVGFDNQTTAPALTGAPSDVRTAFHADKINALVNRYASERFEVWLSTSNLPRCPTLSFSGC
jgi:hypothetical protein